MTHMRVLFMFVLLLVPTQPYYRLQTAEIYPTNTLFMWYSLAFRCRYVYEYKYQQKEVGSKL